jgi:hypothetical protein
MFCVALQLYQRYHSMAEYERLLGESRKWVSKVKAGNIWMMDAWISLHYAICNMLGPPLNATTFTRDQ